MHTLTHAHTEGPEHSLKRLCAHLDRPSLFKETLLDGAQSFLVQWLFVSAGPKTPVEWRERARSSIGHWGFLYRNFKCVFFFISLCGSLSVFLPLALAHILLRLMQACSSRSFEWGLKNEGESWAGERGGGMIGEERSGGEWEGMMDKERETDRVCNGWWQVLSYMALRQL